MSIAFVAICGIIKFLNSYKEFLVRTITVIRTLFSRFMLLFVIALFIVPFLIIAAIPQRVRVNSRLVYRTIQIFYLLLLRVILVPIYYKGLENLADDPAIIVANHQSSLDIPLIGTLMKSKLHMWFARSELLRSWLLRYLVPVFAVIVDVNSVRSAARSLFRIIKIVRHTGGNLIIFPEGARYADGQIHEFFGGFVILAKKLQRPVVPVRIFGANVVYPLGAFFIGWHPITLVIGKPMWIEDGESADTFKERVRQWFIDQKAE
jgi:1-acyl-sn-glycerol-3-phosphate acyltransferase